MVIYLLIAGMLPIALLIANFVTKNDEIEQLERNLQKIQVIAMQREQKQALNLIVREHFKGSDPLYIDKHLETLTFITPELENLRVLLNNTYFAGDEIVRQRFNYLTGSENRLLFVEGAVQNYPYFKETIANLARSVEVSLEDLKKILSLIEGVEINGNKPEKNRPQFIITDFKLDKKEATKDNFVFVLNLKLLKREFL